MLQNSTFIFLLVLSNNFIFKVKQLISIFCVIFKILIIEKQMKKGLKVTDKIRSKLVGVACDSLKELLEKGCKKLGISEEVTAVLNDGTIIDDESYFAELPPQTVIVLYKKSETILTGVDFVLEVLRQVNKSYLQIGAEAKDALMDKTKELLNLIQKSETKNLNKNTRQEDPDWFDGLETNARSKDEYMNRRSQDRIRGYLYKFQEDVRKSNIYVSDSNCRKRIQECILFFKKNLKSDNYFGCYFDRRFAPNYGRKEVDELPEKRTKKNTESHVFDEISCNESLTYDKFSYCDTYGNFFCQGKWKEDHCEFGNSHYINPYSSRETRILFSTWNLDHRIERTRVVVPTLLSAVKSCGEYQSINFMYFYQLLFTKTNLKLVHVVCHDKSIHNAPCDLKLLYL